MAITQMDYTGGGGGINPTLIDKGPGNTDYRNHAYNVTNGKTYLFTYISSNSVNDTSVEGGTALLIADSNYTPWSTNINGHAVVVKATSTTLKFKNSTVPIYSPMLIQLD